MKKKKYCQKKRVKVRGNERKGNKKGIQREGGN